MKHRLNARLVALSIFGFAIIALPAIPPAWAADLSLKPAKSGRVHAVRHKRPLLRDYDGTLIRLGPYRPVGGGPASGHCATFPVQIAIEVRVRYISDGAVQRCRLMAFSGRAY
jgi:hypothetical protein